MMAVLHWAMAAVYSHVMDSDKKFSEEVGKWGGSRRVNNPISRDVLLVQ